MGLVTSSKETFCHACSKWFHYLGIASHRAGHRRRGEDCRITYTNGETYIHLGNKKAPERCSSFRREREGATLPGPES